MKNKQNHNDSEISIEGISENELKRKSFCTPKTYFDDLTPRIMENVRASSHISEPARTNWQTFLFPSIGLACVAIVAFFMIYKNTASEADFDKVLASFTVAELTEYADLQPAELISYNLVNYTESSIESNDLSQEDVIDYLSSEDEFELNTVIDEIEI